MESNSPEYYMQKIPFKKLQTIKLTQKKNNNFKICTRGDKWYQWSIFFNTEISCDEEDVPEIYINKTKKKQKINKNSSLLTNPTQPLKNSSEFSQIKEKKDDKLNDSLNNTACNAEVRKKVEFCKKRCENRYNYFLVALDKMLSIEKAEDENKKGKKKKNTIKKKSNFKILSLNIFEKPTLDFENDYFDIKDLTLFCESKNVVALNFFDFFMINNDRVIKFDENGECLHCKAHKTKTHILTEKNCPFLKCNCVECYTVDFL